MKLRPAALASTVLALVVIGVLGFALLRPAERSSTAPPEERVALLAETKRKPLPEVAGKTLVPPPARLDLASLRGLPVFIDVWASWCPSCEEEAPMLARLWRAHGRQVRFVGIDTQDTRGAGRTFVRRHGLGYPHLFDPRSTLATRLGVYGIPTMFLVDRQGRVAATLVGKQGEGKLRRYLRLLARE